MKGESVTFESSWHYKRAACGEGPASRDVGAPTYGAPPPNEIIPCTDMRGCKARMALGCLRLDIFDRKLE